MQNRSAATATLGEVMDRHRRQPVGVRGLRAAWRLATQAALLISAFVGTLVIFRALSTVLPTRSALWATPLLATTVVVTGNGVRALIRRRDSLPSVTARRHRRPEERIEPRF
jgi:hypothetical protein